MKTYRYIPAADLQRLNRMAKRKRMNHLADDCPILGSGHNVPIVFVLPSGVVATGWVRCQLPTTPDCTEHVLLDVRDADYRRLPTVEMVT